MKPKHPLLPHGRRPSLAELVLLGLLLVDTAGEELSVVVTVYVLVGILLRGICGRVKLTQPREQTQHGGA